MANIIKTNDNDAPSSPEDRPIQQKDSSPTNKEGTIPNVSEEDKIGYKEEKQESIDHRDLLNFILSKIRKVDFTAEIDLNNGRPTKALYKILSIENILEVANQNGVRLNRHEESIYAFNGSYWKKIHNNTIRQFLSSCSIKQEIPRLMAKDIDFEDLLFRQLMKETNKPIIADESDSVKINLKNGTIEFDNGKHKLRTPEEKDFITYELPFDFDPSAKCPMFMEFLEFVLPDYDSRLVLSEYIGYVFTNSNSLKIEKMLALDGGGHNGKSVVFDVITALLGKENICFYSMEGLTKENSRSRIGLEGKLLNYTSEATPTSNFSMAKTLISGEPIEGRELFKNPRMIYNYAKLMVNTNGMVSPSEKTAAYYRRLMIIPFNIFITEEKKDIHLAKKIIAKELSGIFNWAIKGLDRIVKNEKFTDSKLVKDAVYNFAKSNDNIELFFEEERYIKSDIYRTPLKELYLEFRIYCSESGSREMKKSNFKLELIRKKIKMTQANNIISFGISKY